MKLKIFTPLFLLIFLLSFAFGAIAQEQKPTDIIAGIPKVKSADWQLLTTLENIGISYKYAECHDDMNGIHREDVFLKLTNAINVPVLVEYDLVLWYNGKCINCDATSPELHYTINLNAQGEKEGSCADNSDAMRFLSTMINTPGATSKLTNFGIRNLKVSSK